tara:strand:- start:2644 stop:4194 length:1551 start_codon:yes stop_codon:yes gene_type:complete
MAGAFQNMGPRVNFPPGMLQLPQASSAMPLAAQGQLPTDPMARAQMSNPLMSASGSNNPFMPQMMPPVNQINPLASQNRETVVAAAGDRRGALGGLPNVSPRDVVLNEAQRQFNRLGKPSTPRSSGTMSDISKILKGPFMKPDNPNDPLYMQNQNPDKALYEGLLTGSLKGMNQTGSPLQQASKMAMGIFGDIKTNQKQIKKDRVDAQTLALSRAKGGLEMMKLENDMNQGTEANKIQKIKAMAELAKAYNTDTPLIKSLKAAGVDLNTPEGQQTALKILEKSPTTNINTGDKRIVNRFSTGIDALQEGYQNAGRGIANHSRMIELLAGGMQTGAEQSMLKPFREIVGGFLGMDPAAAATLNKQTLFKMLGAENVLAAAENIKGALSDKDLQFLKDSQASLRNEEGANISMLQYTMAGFERRKDAYKEYKRWYRATKKAKGNVSDEAATFHMDDWSEQRPDIPTIVTNKAQKFYESLSGNLTPDVMKDRITKRFGVPIFKSMVAKQQAIAAAAASQ